MESTTAPTGIEDIQWIECRNYCNWVEEAELSMKMKECAASWSAAYSATLQKTQSVVLAAELILSHVVSVTKCLGTPNPILTAVCCTLLEYLRPTNKKCWREFIASKNVLISDIFLSHNAMSLMLDLPSPYSGTSADILIRHCKQQQRVFIDRVADARILSRTNNAGCHGILSGYLFKMPVYEHVARMKYHFLDFRGKEIIAQKALCLKGKVLKRGIRHWQRTTIRIILKAWQLVIKTLLHRAATLRRVTDRSAKRMLVHRHFCAWRLHTISVTMSRKREHARHKVRELVLQCNDQECTIQSTEKLIAELRAKAARAENEKQEAATERQSDSIRLDHLHLESSHWKTIITNHIRDVSKLKYSVNFTCDIEAGRREVEFTILPWVRSLLEDKETCITNYSSNWKDGTLILKLLSIACGLTIPNIPSEASRRVELASELLGSIGIEAVPKLIYEGASDIVVCLLCRIWSRYGRLRSFMKSKPRGTSLSDIKSDYSERNAELSFVSRNVISWMQAKHILHEYCLSLMLRRGRGSPMDVLSSVEIASTAKSIGSLGNFCTSHFVPHFCTESEICDADIHLLQQTTQRHFVDLSKIFSKYSSFGQMDFAQYTRFLTDCKLLTRIIKKPAAAKLFAKINIINKEMQSVFSDRDEVTSSSMQLNKNKSTEDEVVNMDSRFIASEFIQLLVILSLFRSKEDKKSKNKKISSIFENTITKDLSPNAGCSTASELRKNIWSESVQAVVDTHRKDLMWLFTSSACRDAEAHLKNSGKGIKKTSPVVADPNTLSLDEWLLLLEQLNLLDDILTQKEATLVFRQFQDDADTKEGWMVYCEFEDALCCLAVYHVRNPYAPLAVRVRTFLSYLLSCVHQLQGSSDFSSDFCGSKLLNTERKRSRRLSTRRSFIG